MGKDNDYLLPKDPIIKVRTQSLPDLHIGQSLNPIDLSNAVKPAW